MRLRPERQDRWCDLIIIVSLAGSISEQSMMIT
jgi:hypothetical protein